MATIQPAKKNQQVRTVAELVDNIQELTVEIQELYTLDAIPWVIGYSGGKDSTATLQLIDRNVDGEISVEPIPGPYTKYWREHWVRRVLEAQTQIRRTAPENMRDITLITSEELSEIRHIWLEEKHEFDDSLPRIYMEVTGEAFLDSRPGADYSLLGTDEWAVLEEICEGDGMHLELMAKLLDTERQHRKMSRRVGIYDKLEKCFDTSSRSPEEAIKNAHYKRDLKTAAGSGDVEKVKQLTLGDVAVTDEAEPKTWGSMKFKNKKDE